MTGIWRFESRLRVWGRRSIFSEADIQSEGLQWSETGTRIAAVAGIGDRQFYGSPIA